MDSESVTNSKGDDPLPESSASGRVECNQLTGERQLHLKRHFWLGLLILLCFTFGKVWFAHTPKGHWFHMRAYDWLHGLAFETSPPQRVPVVLVDISRIFQRSGSSVNTGDLEFTPRAELAALIDKLALTDAPANSRPIAIGVDLDFSVEDDGMVLPGSFQFFDGCLAHATNGLPVFLGVRRMEPHGPAAWLGALKYAPLAVSISRREGSVSRLTFAYEFGSPSNTLPSLSAALAAVARTQSLGMPERNALPTWLTADLASTQPVAGLKNFRETSLLVDFSQLEAIRSSALRHTDLLTLPPERLRRELAGKIVLLGDVFASQASDTAVVPGRNDSISVPGVLVHACAIDTLTRAGLLELNHWVGLMLSFTASLFCLWLIHRVCLKYSAYGEVSPIALNLLLTVALMAGLLTMSWLLMKLGRVMWLEVVAVCAFLFLHFIVEVLLATVHWNKLKASKLKNLEGLVSVPNTRQHS